MHGDQIAERFRVAAGSRDGGFAAVDASFDLEGPLLVLLPAEECLIDRSSVTPRLSAPGPGIELCKTCALRGTKLVEFRIKGLGSWRKKSAN